MNYIRLHIQIPEDYQELLIAELFDRDFDGFEQEENLLIASTPAERFDDTKREEIQYLINDIREAQLLKEEVVTQQNWNQKWEESIEPQTIGRFFIRPTWSDQRPHQPDQIELMIDPKMAFGTGYHATTRLMLEMLEQVVQKGDRVLDAGTGTGILGIASLKLGASSVFGFDIDEWSEANARDNIALNRVQNFEVRLGSTEVVPDGLLFDLILANINRNALAYMLPDLLSKLKEGGKILLSGLLEEDEEFMLNHKPLNKLKHVETRHHQEWIALLFAT